MSSTETTQIVSGPTPDEYGNARFVVQVGERRVDAIAGPEGSGLSEADFDLWREVSDAVSEFRKRDPERLHACLCEAAKLRRAAGNTTALAVPVSASIAVRPDPELRRTGARFTVDVGASSVAVLVTEDGAIVDDYDPVHHPTGEVRSEDLLAARRAALDYVLAHSEHSVGWGLDCDLLELFWK
jgi:hypothetical protein